MIGDREHDIIGTNNTGIDSIGELMDMVHLMK